MSDLVAFVMALRMPPKPAGTGCTMSLAEIATGKRVEQLPTPRVVDLGEGHWVAVGHERPCDRGAVAVAMLKGMLHNEQA